MKPFVANLINSITLLAMGAWGYYAATQTADPEVGVSPTVFIAPAIGLLLLLSTPMLKKENKVVAHIVVLLTFLLIIALVKPLMSAFGKEDMTAAVRVGIMMITGVIAMVAFIKSFRDARKAREAGNA